MEKIPKDTVLTRNEAALVERAQAYVKGIESSKGQEKGYTYLLGRTLFALKEACEHGRFLQIRKAEFPDRPDRTLDRAMEFVQAVHFNLKPKSATVADLKTATVAHLKDEQLLLGLTDHQKDQVVSSVNDATGERGVVETINEWRKKTAPKAAPVDAVTRAAEHVKNVEAIFERAEAALLGVLNLKVTDFVLCEPGKRFALQAVCVRVSKRVMELRGRK